MVDRSVYPGDDGGVSNVPVTGTLLVDVGRLLPTQPARIGLRAGEVGLAYGWGARGGVGMVQDLAEYALLGRDPMRVEAFWHAVYRDGFWAAGGGPVVYGALSALDLALWDIRGKALQQPAHVLLGGPVREEVEVYANGWFSGLAAPEAYAERAAEVVADGFRALKFDPLMADLRGRVQYTERFMPRELEDLAVARVRAVREAVGPDVRMILDLHGALGPASAIRFLGRVAEFDLLYAEEPVDALSLPAMEQVAARAPMPLAAGERLYSRYHVRPFLEAGCLGVLQPDLCLAGGLSEARKIATMAETWGVAIQPHNCGGPVAAAACIQLDLATPNFAIQEWFPYWWDDRIEIAMDPLEPKVRNSRLAAPGGAGLGIELNDAYLARFPSRRIEA